MHKPERMVFAATWAPTARTAPPWMGLSRKREYTVTKDWAVAARADLSNGRPYADFWSVVLAFDCALPLELPLGLICPGAVLPAGRLRPCVLFQLTSSPPLSEPLDSSDWAVRAVVLRAYLPVPLEQPVVRALYVSFLVLSTFLALLGLAVVPVMGEPLSAAPT